MPKLNLKKEDLETIKSTVHKAESKTSGEIATAIIKESSDYATYELIFSIVGGFIYFFIAMYFSDALETSLKSLSWDYSPKHILLFYGVSTLLMVFIFYLIANIRFIDRLIVPKKVMAREVTNRALRHFTQAGVFNTRDRTGILLFISELEQRVELIADQGINEKIDQVQWNQIINTLVEGIKNKDSVSAICSAILSCGELLTKHFPIKADDTNELDNDISVLEK